VNVRNSQAAGKNTFPGSNMLRSLQGTTLKQRIYTIY